MKTSFRVGLVLLSIILFPQLSFSAQSVYQQWATQFHSTNNDIAAKIAYDSQGNVYSTTNVYNESTNSWTYKLIKYNSSGAQLWVRASPNQRSVQSLEVFNNTVYLLTNAINESSQSNIYLDAYDLNGNKLWSYGFGGNQRNEARAMVVDKKTGDLLVLGAVYATPEVSSFVILKYNREGVLTWSRFYSGPEQHLHEPKAISVDAEGNVVVIGALNYYTKHVTLKYSWQGSLLWERIKTIESDGGGSVAIGKNGDIYIGITNILFDDVNYMTLRYDTNGNQIWEREFTIPEVVDQVSKVLVDDLDNVYVGGTTATLKYDRNGVLLWSFFDPEHNTGANQQIALDSNKNVFISGPHQTANNEFDIKTIKLNYLGQKQQEVIYKGSVPNFTNSPVDLKIDGFNNVYLLAQTSNQTQGENLLTLKYASVVSINIEGAPTTLSRGQEFKFYAKFTNQLNETVSVIYRSTLATPQNKTVAVVTPMGITLAPKETKTIELAHKIPVIAPLGSYTYNVYVGTIYESYTARSFSFVVKRQSAMSFEPSSSTPTEELPVE